MTVGIIGLGLMGGSMGIALKNLPEISRILGHDHNTKHCEEALALGLVDGLTDFEGICACDVIFLAIPVEGIIRTLRQFENLPKTSVVIDLGSTKAKIVRNIPSAIRRNVVAAHPMNGTEFSGPTAAKSDLYRDKIVVFCNPEESGKHQVKVALNLFGAIGMKIVTMDAEDHDRHAAYISHLPHAISYGLANAVLAQEDAKNILILAAGGFRDMSRLAKSSPAMWVDIFKQNRENLLESMDHLEEELHVCRRLIQDEAWEELGEWMQRASSLYEIL